MTEVEWLTATDPLFLLNRLGERGSGRKYRLFVCECCRRIWHLLTDLRSQQAVESAERYAEGQISQNELSAAQVAADRALSPGDERTVRHGPLGQRVSKYRSWAAGSAAKAVARPTNVLKKLLVSLEMATHYALLAEFGDRYSLARSDTKHHADLFRDIFGNSFRTVTLAPHWQTETAVTLAAGIYAERAFDRMPILADALEDVGCDNSDILSHCRGTGPHVRGCWVVDLILGKS